VLCSADPFVQGSMVRNRCFELFFSR
jgi:hypothetical protein